VAGEAAGCGSGPNWTVTLQAGPVLALTPHARARLNKRNPMKRKYKRQWGYDLAKSPYPGIYFMERGGCYARARVKLPATGQLKTIKKVLRDLSAAEASAWLVERKKTLKTEPAKAQQSQHFGHYALSVLEKKVKRKELSPEKASNWKYTLEHLIGGVREYEKIKVNGVSQKRVTKVLVPGFGNHIISEIRVKDVESWKTKVAVLINEGKYKPSSGNVWLTTLKTIMKEARRELEIGHDAFKGVTEFDESEHDPHPEEDPNALMDEQVPMFLCLLKESYPHFYAMAVFGFATGLRGINISALRYRGPEADINWETGLCYVRRGAGRLGGIRNTTKVRRRYRITLPPSLLEVLRWHVEQIPEGAPRDSNYLFPSEKGTPRLAQVMNGPFADISQRMGLSFILSVSGMRRTYNDLALAAGVNNLVTRSISGHQTQKMQAHYTTVWAPRQLEAIGAVMDLMAGKAVKTAPRELLAVG
jgi:hypothetical protein